MTEVERIIAELKYAIEKLHPNAKLEAITLNRFAQDALIYQMHGAYGNLYAAPLQLNQTKTRIKSIFGVNIIEGEK